MEYNFKELERKWQQSWKDNNVYKVSNESEKPKCYVLDMFPYPSGAGLHVGHPLGYIASDIYSRYKRLKGFNVLHPMGFDSFGLPAEQYAIETGQHPADTTEKNIATFKNQLDKIGFCYDWSREVRTSDASYYKWTQWIFLQLFHSYFCNTQKKARPISDLIAKYESTGCKHFTAEEWKGFNEKQQSEWLMKRRLAFCAYGEVNWCEALGTVLANDEVVNGVSERGGHPVEKKKMRQWYLRITDYADRLLEGLDKVDFSESMKEMQRNWIGKSQGAEMEFSLIPSPSPQAEKGDEKNVANNEAIDALLQSQTNKVQFKNGPGVKVYTTRPDTVFGVDFIVVAPEHELVLSITTADQKEEIEKYLTYVKSRSDRERQAEVKQITGCFTGAYAINPFSGKEIPIWIAEYVLAGYGTGAIMGVPCGDQRDFAFAKHFNIPITNIIGSHFNGTEANPTKEAILENAGFLDGLLMKDAINVANNKIEELGIGKRKVNYRMRDAGFSRQRYWGEPFPIIWSDGIALPLDAEELPLELPHVDKYGPGPEGEGPLANIREWVQIPSSPSPLPVGEEGVKENEAKGLIPIGENEAISEERYAPKYNVGTPLQYEFAKKMRKDYTGAEDVLWQELRANKTGAKFRRQHPIEAYIADFVCLHSALIIEVDGGYHENAEQKIYDEERTRILNAIGFTVIRFSNEEVTQHIENVLEKIKEKLANIESDSKKGSNILESHTNKEQLKKDELSHPSPRSGDGMGERETSTMPGYAGSSWYFLRYMDPHNSETFCDRKASDYWNQVDLYIGGTEHAVGHLLYSRMWTKVLFDLGLIGFDEPFKKLLNQGMITGKSYFFNVDTLDGEQVITSYKKNPDAAVLRFKYGHQFVDTNGKLTKKKFEESGAEITNRIKWEQESGEEFLLMKEESEKMSKSKFNVDNPDDMVEKYGADTFRMYEMFLGPVEQSKPWDTKGIEGVHRFLRKLWRLFNDELKGRAWTEEKASDAELKILHRTIKKIEEDTEKFSFNTAVSAFMIAVNELADIKCHKKEILEPLLILLVPYAPHIAEELYQQLRSSQVASAGEDLPGASILDASYPKLNASLLVESSKEYPVSINGKVRTNLTLALDLQQNEVEKLVLENDIVVKWLEGKAPKKIIYVKNKMINVVI